MNRPLNIFVPHCSDLLTDHRPHGDGMIADGFIRSLARRGHRLHVAVEAVDLREALPANVSLYPLTVRRTLGGLKRLDYMIRVGKLFRQLHARIGFDLIHQLNPVFTGISLALYGSGVPLVLGTYVARWPEDAEEWPLRSRLLHRAVASLRNGIARLQQAPADALLLTTPAALNRIPRYHTVRDRVHLLPHGLDTQLFSPAPDWDSRERSLAEQNSPSILFFANVQKRKGIFTLLEAFPNVCKQVPHCRLTIAGDGPELPEVKRRVAGLSCGKQVEFLGRQERSAAPGLYRNCAVYCLPSFGEPHATTIIEALSCARPVVATNAGGSPHIVHQEGGRCVCPGDSQALAKALIEVLQDPGQRLSMGRYNRRLVEEAMSWDRVAQRLEAIYDMALVRHATAGTQNLGFVDGRQKAEIVEARPGSLSLHREYRGPNL